MYVLGAANKQKVLLINKIKRRVPNMLNSDAIRPHDAVPLATVFSLRQGLAKKPCFYDKIKAKL